MGETHDHAAGGTIETKYRNVTVLCENR